MIKISVIVPAYNQENRLHICMDSLVNQTFKDIELIIINDGSTDKSLEIINKYKQKYPKMIKVITRENKGISASRNEGLSIAKGKYVGFVDSDDYIELDMYEKLYNKIEQEKCDIVICNFKMFYENSDEIIYKNLGLNFKTTTLDETPNLVYTIDYSPWNKLYKKELWNDIRYPLNLKYEDLEAILKIFNKAKSIAYIDDYLYNYLQNPKGETSTVDRRVYDIYTILSNLKETFDLKSNKLKKAYKELCISKIFIYNHFILNGKNREFSKEFMNYGYEYINKNFKHWKLDYILKSRGFKNFIIRVLQTNKYLYYKYIDYRTK